MRPYTHVGGTPVAVVGTTGTPMPPGIVGVVGRFMGHSWRSGALGAAATARIRGHNGRHMPFVAAFQAQGGARGGRNSKHKVPQKPPYAVIAAFQVWVWWAASAQLAQGRWGRTQQRAGGATIKMAATCRLLLPFKFGCCGQLHGA